MLRPEDSENSIKLRSTLSQDYHTSVLFRTPIRCRYYYFDTNKYSRGPEGPEAKVFCVTVLWGVSSVEGTTKEHQREKKKETVKVLTVENNSNKSMLRGSEKCAQGEFEERAWRVQSHTLDASRTTL